MRVKLLTEHHLEFLSLKGGFTGLSESTLVKMSHCWKTHVAAHMILPNIYLFISIIFMQLLFYLSSVQSRRGHWPSFQSNDPLLQLECTIFIIV